MGAICSRFQRPCYAVAPGDAIRAGAFFRGCGNSEDGVPDGPLDDAAMVTRCGGACQAGERASRPSFAKLARHPASAVKVVKLGLGPGERPSPPAPGSDLGCGVGYGC
jgi:hypothetical protein